LKISNHRAGRWAALYDHRHRSGVFFLVVCGDPRHQAQAGFACFSTIVSVMNELSKKLLAADEPAPVTVYNADGESPFVLVADHASEIFWPYHQRIEAELDRRPQTGCPAALISLHSFTPVFEGATRPWHAGVLYNRDPRSFNSKKAALFSLNCRTRRKKITNSLMRGAISRRNY
jgi:hypothetical protein